MDGLSRPARSLAFLSRVVVLALALGSTSAAPISAGAAPGAPGLPRGTRPNHAEVVSRPDYLVPPEHQAPIQPPPVVQHVKRPARAGAASPAVASMSTTTVTWGRNTEGELGNNTIDGDPMLTTPGV